MSELKFSPIDEIIADLKAGKLVIVADDPGRENEADLVGAERQSDGFGVAQGGQGGLAGPAGAANSVLGAPPPQKAGNRGEGVCIWCVASRDVEAGERLVAADPW